MSDPIMDFQGTPEQSENSLTLTLEHIFCETSKYPEVPQSTQKYLNVPKSTSKYLEVPQLITGQKSE